MTKFLSVASQNYKMDVHPEYVMLGNDVLLKCSFPSFVADFVAVLSWIDSEASEYSLGTNHEGNSARNRLHGIFSNTGGTANMPVWLYLLLFRIKPLNNVESQHLVLWSRDQLFRFSCQPGVPSFCSRRVCCSLQRCDLQVQHPEPCHSPRNCLGLG